MEKLRPRVQTKGWKVAQEFYDDRKGHMVKQDAMSVEGSQAGMGWTWHMALQRIP